MAAFEPFEPQIRSGVAGQTVSLAIGAGSGTSTVVQIVNSISAFNPSLLITFGGGVTAGTVAYVRLSVEASTAITATVTDTPILAPSVRLFANPNPQGTLNIAVIVSTTPTAAGTIWFTAGQGGAI